MPNLIGNKLQRKESAKSNGLCLEIEDDRPNKHSVPQMPTGENSDQLKWSPSFHSPFFLARTSLNAQRKGLVRKSRV